MAKFSPGNRGKTSSEILCRVASTPLPTMVSGNASGAFQAQQVWQENLRPSSR